MEFVDLESLLKLLLAAVLGAIVGVERRTHGRPAGMRTHALVCVASTLLIIISRTGAISGLAGPNNFMLNVDPSRMAAGIVTGIGFLGAGAILRIRDNLIRGLTTAACIWFVAALGVAVGSGAYGLSVAATAAALFILVLLDHLEGTMGVVAYRSLVVEMDIDRRETVEKSCRILLEQRKMRIQQVTYDLDNTESKAECRFSVRISAKHDKPDLITEIANLPGVKQVKWF
ncbi:MAG: MgtC/SapB family protein [Deltaproteobacteria bacterium]|nr:MgtC/SapB family protein [Deltaproteobacteria bacterium]